MSKTTRQLTKTHRGPVFKVPPTSSSFVIAWQGQSNNFVNTLTHSFSVHRDLVSLRTPDVFDHISVKCQGAHSSNPPLPLKAAHTRHDLIGQAVNRFSSVHLQYWRQTTVDPWVWTTLNKGYTLQFRFRPPKFSRIFPTVIGDAVHLPVLAGRHVLIQSDNNSMVFHLNLQGGTRSLRSLHLTCKILMWSLPRLASLRAVHLSGSRNQVADALSRNLLHPGEWRLPTDVVQRIWQQFRRAEIDLFVTEVTTHCRLWFARIETSSPLGLGALSHEWPDCLLYVFPFSSAVVGNFAQLAQCNHRVLLVSP